MRILVTANGTVVIEELETMEVARRANTLGKFSKSSSRKYISTHTKPANQSKILSYTMTKNNSKKSLKKSSNNNSKTNIKDNKDLVDLENDIFAVSDLKNTQTISLNLGKLKMPKKIFQNYESDPSVTQNIITTSSNFLPQIKSTPSNSMSIDNSHITSYNNVNNSNYGSKTLSEMSGMRLYSFNEIIPKEKITKIKIDMIKKQIERNKATTITERDFRTPYESQTKLQKLQDILDYPKVTPNKLSLIKYLNESNSLNPISLSSLASSDQPRMTRINKMCQILYVEKERQKMVDNIIKNKIRAIEANEKSEFNSRIKIMKSEVDEAKKTLSKYENRLSEKEKYKELHSMFVKNYWKDKNFERFDKKKPTPLKRMNITGMSNEEDEKSEKNLLTNLKISNELNE